MELEVENYVVDNMLTPNIDQLLKPLPSVKNQIFVPYVKYSMVHIIPYIHLPLNFELDAFELWRFSAPFYGFFYDATRKNYTLWCTLTLKKNYGFISSLFFRNKNMYIYKRLWSINNQSWEFYSYLFKGSFRLNLNNRNSNTLFNRLYNTQFHNFFDAKNSLFESSEIAVRMSLACNINDWTIEDLDNELDHFISTYDKYKEDRKNLLDRFKNNNKYFFYFIDSTFISNSLYTVGYSNNSVMLPKTYLEHKNLLPFMESVANATFFKNNYFINNNFVKWWYKFNLMCKHVLLKQINIFSDIYNIDASRRKLKLYDFLNPYKNNTIFLDTIVIDNDNFDSSSKWKLLRRKFNLLYNKEFVGSKLAKVCKKYAIVFKARKNYFYKLLHYQPYRRKLYKSWIFLTRLTLNYSLFRFGKARFFRDQRDLNVFMRRPFFPDYNTFFHVYFYNKVKDKVYLTMSKYICNLALFAAKIKWNFITNCNLYNKYKIYSYAVYDIFINHMQFIKSRLVTWSYSPSVSMCNKIESIRDGINTQFLCNKAIIVNNSSKMLVSSKVAKFLLQYVNLSSWYKSFDKLVGSNIFRTKEKIWFQACKNYVFDNKLSFKKFHWHWKNYNKKKYNYMRNVNKVDSETEFLFSLFYGKTNNEIFAPWKYYVFYIEYTQLERDKAAKRKFFRNRWIDKKVQRRWYKHLRKTVKLGIQFIDNERRWKIYYKWLRTSSVFDLVPKLRFYDKFGNELDDKYKWNHYRKLVKKNLTFNAIQKSIFYDKSLVESDYMNEDYFNYYKRPRFQHVKFKKDMEWIFSPEHKKQFLLANDLKDAIKLLCGWIDDPKPIEGKDLEAGNHKELLENV